MSKNKIKSVHWTTGIIAILAIVGLLLGSCGDGSGGTLTGHPITKTTGGGGTSIASPARADAGTTVEIRATPNSGFKFAGWVVEEGGISLTNNNPTTFEMPDNPVRIKAEFTELAEGTPNLYFVPAIPAQGENFGTLAYGYTQPAERTFNLHNNGKGDATVTSWTGSSGSFTVTGNTVTPQEIAVNANHAVTVRPNANLAVGIHTGTIIATYDDGATATLTVRFTVTQAPGGAVSGAPTVNGSPTNNSITVNAVTNAGGTGQDVQYAIAQTNTPVPTSGWQPGTTFSSLTSGTTYYVFARTAANTNYLAGAHQVSAPITTAATTITSVTITGITAPVAGQTPSTASSGTGNYTRGNVTWSPAHSPFQAPVVYTASIILTANPGYIFTGLTTATMNGTAATVSNNTGTTVTLSREFPETVAPVISIGTQPAENTTVGVGNINSNLNVSASVTLSATLSYQWYSNTIASNEGGSPVASGGTNASFPIPANLSAGVHYFFVEVRATGGAAPLRSNPATVYVTPTVTNTVDIAHAGYRLGSDVVTAIHNSLAAFDSVNVIGERNGINISITIPAGKEVNWTALLTGSCSLNFDGTGTLSITGGGVASTGNNGITINGGGLLNISGAQTLITASGTVNNQGPIRISSDGARLNMSGGTIRNDGGTGARAINNGYSVHSNIEITISGGLVQASWYAIISNSPNGIITINGGEILSTSASGAQTIRLDSTDGGNLVINSGEVKSNPSQAAISVNAANDDARRARVEYNGGTIEPWPLWLTEPD